MTEGIARAICRMLGGCCIGLLAFVSISTGVAAELRTYTMAIVPQVQIDEVEQAWNPVVERISQDAGIKIQLQLYPSIPQFESAFLAGSPDFVYLNPYHQVMAKRAQGYIPLVRDGSALLSGVLVVRHDSPIHTVQDLDGKVIAFPAPHAFGASLYMRGLLGELYRLNIKPDYVGNHDNVIRDVLAGEAAAGGIVRSMLQRKSAGLRDQLRVLYETPAVAPHPLSAHPRIPREVRDKVVASILAMASDPEGARSLGAVMLPRPVKADYARDYARLEQINLKKYLVSPVADKK